MNLCAIKETIIIKYQCWVILRLLKKCRDRTLEKGASGECFTNPGQINPFIKSNRLKDYL